mmetsp:Transcript_14606/g.45864  ORF Transcript_14606/g.45864 Transcript_14606/m.45864 type:complete len:117 (-) Transcript_14606:180-530(-)
MDDKAPTISDFVNSEKVPWSEIKAKLEAADAAAHPLADWERERGLAGVDTGKAAEKAAKKAARREAKRRERAAKKRQRGAEPVDEAELEEATPDENESILLSDFLDVVHSATPSPV